MTSFEVVLLNLSNEEEDDIRVQRFEEGEVRVINIRMNDKWGSWTFSFEKSFPPSYIITYS